MRAKIWCTNLALLIKKWPHKAGSTAICGDIQWLAYGLILQSVFYQLSST